MSQPEVQNDSNDVAEVDDGGKPVPQLLWRYGDEWRDLTNEVRRLVVTVVTENGTTRVLNLPGGWQRRLPLPEGHALRLDHVRQTLTAVIWASPCGIHTTSRGFYAWHMTTAVAAVVAGDHPHWVTTTAALKLLEAPRDSDAQLTGHPLAACPVPYCVRNEPPD